MSLNQLLYLVRGVLLMATVVASVNLVLLLGNNTTQSAPTTPPPLVAALKTTKDDSEVVVPIATTTKKDEPAVVAPTEPKPQEIPEPEDPTPPETAQEPPPPKTFLSLEEVNQNARPAVVNILCTAKGTGAFQPISGSGIIIDERGIILTNAHVAQYFLLEKEINCVVRTGSPARATYRAELLFIPPAWLDANAQNITITSPQGTGEHDYAFLHITTRIDGTATPDTFSHLSPKAKDIVDADNKMLIVAYPSEFVGAITTQLSLYQASTLAHIDRAFYFHDNEESLDLYSLGGSILAQGGSSGGAVVDLEDGFVVGVIVTSTQADTTAEKNLRAVSISHIDRSLYQQIGLTLVRFLNDDPKATTRWFRTSLFNDLRQQLLDAIT